MRTYEELIKFNTFLERYEYLKLNGLVSEETFGYNRWLNQIFYTSKEWKDFRKFVIDRDNACDLACEGHDIFLKRDIMIHHLNPITMKQIYQRDPSLLDLNNVVCVSLKTHNAIHYGSSDIIETDDIITRKKNDTCPWNNL